MSSEWVYMRAETDGDGIVRGEFYDPSGSLQKGQTYTISDGKTIRNGRVLQVKRPEKRFKGLGWKLIVAEETVRPLDV